jgi:hypothetical protein
MMAILLSSKFLIVRACVVAREKVTPVTLVCGRLEEERKTVFCLQTCQGYGVLISSWRTGGHQSQVMTLMAASGRIWTRRWSRLQVRWEQSSGSSSA